MIAYSGQAVCPVMMSVFGQSFSRALNELLLGPQNTVAFLQRVHLSRDPLALGVWVVSVGYTCLGNFLTAFDLLEGRSHQFVVSRNEI